MEINEANKNSEIDFTTNFISIKLFFHFSFFQPKPHKFLT